MKIAHVAPEYYPAIGGVGQVVRELAQRQVKAGHDVSVFVPDWDKKRRIAKKSETIKGVKVYRCKYVAQVANFSTIWPSVLFKLIKGDFDIIHSHNFGHLHVFLSAIASKLAGAKHIHTTHCPWSDAKRSLVGKIGLYISYNIFSRWALKEADAIIAITPWEISHIKKHGGQKEKIIVIPNGMSKEFFTKIKNNDLRENYNIGKSKKIVLFLGRLNVTKGPDQFIRIAKLILNERKDVFFIIRGPDEGMKSTVKKMMGNEKNILLLDKTTDKKELMKTYQSADVYVMPSYREGLPLTLFEAMASGLPIVATPVNGIPFELKDGVNGFLVSYSDTSGFKKKILELLDNRRLHDMIVKNNLKKSREYDWDILSKKTLGIYSNALLNAKIHSKSN